MSKTSCRRKGCNRIRSEFSLFLSRRRAPRFEGYPFCSESCLQAHVGGELLDRWNRLQRDKRCRIPRPRLGSILLQTGFITPAQLDEAVNLQRQTGQGRLGDWLQRLGFVEEHQITLATSKQYGLPLINLRSSEARSDAVKMIPGRIAKRAGLLPVGYDDDRDSLRVAVKAPINFSSHEAIRRMVHKGILPYLGDESAIMALLAEHYGGEETDLPPVPTFSSPAELADIGGELVSAAYEYRADDMQAELIEDLLWVRLDFGARSQQVFYRHAAESENSRVPCGERQPAIATAVAF